MSFIQFYVSDTLYDAPLRSAPVRKFHNKIDRNIDVFVSHYNGHHYAYQMGLV